MSAWRETGAGLELFVRATPNASANRIEGVETRDDGSEVLRVRVTAPPDKGKANKAVTALVASAFGLAKSRVVVVSGETARLKLLRIDGPSSTLASKAKNLFQSDA